jgi:hypothetical protein
MTGLYFVVYEQAKKRLQSLEQTFSLTLATAAFSGAVAAWVTSPLDLVKLRLQVSTCDRKSDAGHGAVTEPQRHRLPSPHALPILAC